MSTALEQLLDSPENLEYLARQSRLLSLSPRELFELVEELEAKLGASNPSFRKFVDSASEQIEQVRATSSEPREEDSAYDAFKRAGLIGCIKDGPSDLSTNPKYMEGFGE